jgi:hypothetical protein
VARLPFNTTLAKDVFGVSYLPGFVGLNNLKPTDYVNVVLQSLSHVAPLREFFLGYAMSAEGGRDEIESALVRKYGELICKQWSSRNFKSSISPHEVIQAISTASAKRFHMGQPGVCIDFFSWFLNQMHKDLGGTHVQGSSVIHDAFQGEIEVTSTHVRKKKGGEGKDEEDEEDESKPKTANSPFLFISLELPAAPLFKDSHDGKTIIPVIPMYVGEARRRERERRREKRETNPFILRSIYAANVLSCMCGHGWGTGAVGTYVWLCVTTNQEIDSYTETLCVKVRGALSPPHPSPSPPPSSSYFSSSSPRYDVLKKLDGATPTETLNHLGEITRKRYRITKLPRYLVFNLKRFTKNNWFKVRKKSDGRGEQRRWRWR